VLPYTLRYKEAHLGLKRFKEKGSFKIRSRRPPYLGSLTSKGTILFQTFLKGLRFDSFIIIISFLAFFKLNLSFIPGLVTSNF
jgi:hypothetical protein